MAILVTDGSCTFLDGHLVGMVEHVPAVPPVSREEAEQSAATWALPESRASVIRDRTRGRPEEWRAHWSISKNDRQIRGFEICRSKAAAERAIEDGLDWVLSTGEAA